MDIDEIFKKYGPMVIRRCKTIIKDEDAAMDVSQDVFFKAWQKGKLESVKYHSSYLYTIATNLSLNYLRDNRKNPAALNDETLKLIESQELPEEKVVVRDLLDSVFSREKPSTRTIAYLHYIDGLTLEETAEMVGLSVSGIRKRLRGLKKRSLQMEGFTNDR